MEFIEWFWQLRTDGLITAWVKGNVILSSVMAGVIAYIVKRTATTADDEMIGVIKRRLGIGE